VSMNVIQEKFVRVAIPKRMRFEVFKRDGFECVYCGATPPNVILHCDHINPVSRGGETSIDNLVTACQPCNSGKSNIPLSITPLSLSERAAEVIERESQIAGYEAIMKARRMRLDADAQEALNHFCECYNIESIQKSDFESLKRFIDKLGLDEVLTSIDLAKSMKPYSQKWGWKYFCGTCWGKIRNAGGY